MIGQNRTMIGNLTSPTGGSLDYLIGEILTFQVVRIFNNKTYLLSDIVSFPFVTGDFATELEEGKWIEILTAPPSDGKEYAFKNGVWIENDKSFTFELPYFFWSRFVSTNFARIGSTVGYIQFNADAGTSNADLLVPTADTWVYKIPRNCVLKELLFIANTGAVQLVIYKTPAPNGVSASKIIDTVVTNHTDLNISLNKGECLHFFPRNTTGSAGTNNGRLFLNFK